LSIFLYGKQSRTDISTAILDFGKSANMRRIAMLQSGSRRPAYHLFWHPVKIQDTQNLSSMNVFV